MKTFKTSIVALLLLAAISCKKDNSTSATASVTSDQAADMAASSLASNSGGVASMTDAISANAVAVTSVGGSTINSVGVASVKQACGTTLSDSSTLSGTTSSVTFNYFAKYTHTLNCNAEEQPDNIVNTLAYNGTFSGPRISTTANGTANATIAGLTQTATNFVVNGEYKRAGTFASKVGNLATGNSNLDIVVTNLTLSKPARKIASGTAAITLTGVAGKKSYSFTGNITFNGDGTATLAITGGSTYIVDLGTGLYTKH
ncbi:MAG: hypothetical protein ACHQHN_06710 [Sphingobacteriales bacterium]